MNLSAFINSTVLSGVARYVLGIVLGAFVSKGLLSGQDATSISADVVAALVAIWQAFSSAGHATVVAAVANSGKSVAGSGTTATLTQTTK